ncbi:hypothetical protein Cantr_04896 [Candida viswanathii]|uniref:Uncharacterized protein n=1 Tax=Candida viswanathii TaxID=5486 RepID=A0A367XUK5_9ASCO|nr:hypothetical protein Cantr_04896 [Candida viswanathii]
MNAPPFLKVKEFPSIQEGEIRKVSTCLLVLEFVNCYQRMHLRCTDFTSNPQNGQIAYKQNNLDVPPDQLISFPMLEREFDSLNKSYQEFYNEDFDLVNAYGDNKYLDVSDRLIVITVNLTLRLYKGCLEPYLYDPDLVELKACDTNDKPVVLDLFEEIRSRKEYFKSVEHLAKTMIPEDLRLECSAIAKKESELISIEDYIVDIEFSDDDDELDTSVVIPDTRRVYSVSEIKKMPMCLDETPYLVNAKICGTFPDDWIYLATRMLTPQQIPIRDLELIVADVDVDEETILDEQNSTSVFVGCENLLKLTGCKSQKQFYGNVSRAKLRFAGKMGTPIQLEIMKDKKAINSDTLKVVWSLVQIVS